MRSIAADTVSKSVSFEKKTRELSLIPPVCCCPDPVSSEAVSSLVDASSDDDPSRLNPTNPPSKDPPIIPPVATPVVFKKSRLENCFSSGVFAITTPPKELIYFILYTYIFKCILIIYSLHFFYDSK